MRLTEDSSRDFRCSAVIRQGCNRTRPSLQPRCATRAIGGVVKVDSSTAAVGGGTRFQTPGERFRPTTPAGEAYLKLAVIDDRNPQRAPLASAEGNIMRA